MDQETSETASAVIGHPGTQVDLAAFCGNDDTRPYLLKPFRFGDYSYASNGHIILRTAARNGDVAPVAQAEKMEKYVDRIFARMGDFCFASPPAVDLPAKIAVEPCKSCGGEGVAHSCPDCTCKCEACQGSGEFDLEQKTSTTFAGAFFALNYVRRMLALPGLTIAHGSADAENALPLLFMFDGGAGALMPCSKSYKSVGGSHVEIERPRD